MTGPILDSAAIRNRRITLAISERELARRLGVSATVVDALERGRNHADLHLDVIVRLAEVLGLCLDELLPRAPSASPAGDPATLGRLLGHLAAAVPATTLAQALGWPLERTQAAIDELTQLLPAVGSRIQHSAGGVAIVAAAGEPAPVRQLLRRSNGRRGMTVTQARMLHRVWSGAIDARQLSNPDRVALAHLVNAGLVDYPAGDRRGGTPTLGSDVDLLTEHSADTMPSVRGPAPHPVGFAAPLPAVARTR